MCELSEEFGQGDAVPNDVIEYFSKYDFRLGGMGMISIEDAPFLVLDPCVRILSHQSVSGSHPEATMHLLAGQITLPYGNTYKALFYWESYSLFLTVRPSWTGFSSTFSDLIRRARGVEDESMPAPDLSAAREEFQLFLAKRRDARAAHDAANISRDLSAMQRNERSNTRLIRECRTQATACIKWLERIPY